MKPTLLSDEEFGDIPIKRIAHAKYVRLKVSHNGSLVATMPKSAPLYTLKSLLDNSREKLRQAIYERSNETQHMYSDGELVGTSHKIVLLYGSTSTAKKRGQSIIWTVKNGEDYSSAENQSVVRAAVKKALTEQARAYLPRRLHYFADIGGFRIGNIRYGNAKGRWGSCSSEGVITLNVALMKLPKELIDYVLVHELAHTKQLNHSPSFWKIVTDYYPNYKVARKALKTYSPYL